MPNLNEEQGCRVLRAELSIKETEASGQTWPPPPAVEPPLAAHDPFLTALVRRPSPRPPTTRPRLAWLLHRKTGLGLRHCRMVVNDFCERHDILSYEGIWALRLRGLLLASTVVIPIRLLAYSAYFWMHGQASGAAARLALDRRLDHLTNGVLDPWLHFTLALAVIGTAFALPLQVRLRREAEDARRKLTVGDR